MIFTKQYNCAVATGLVASLTLAGCDKLTQNGQSNTLSLLRAGSERVCAAPDVQDSLRKILLPKPGDLTSDASAEDTQSAIAAVRLSFDLTTLQSFDKSVSRASCETTLHVAGLQGTAEKISVEYQVSPSSDDPSGLVVGTRDREAGSAATAAVKAALEQRLQQRQSDQDTASAREAKAKLLAVISPKWLIGTWIPVGADGVTCGGVEGLVFLPNHEAAIQGHGSRWLLDKDQLRLVGNSANGALNGTNTISQADAVSFTLANGDDDAVNLRRCAPSEIRSFLKSTEGMDTLPDNTAAPN